MTAPRPTILVDQDSVLADWEAHFYAMFTDRHPHLPMLEPSRRTEFNMFLPEYADYHAEILAVMDSAGFYAALEPITGAATALQEMLDAGFDVAICTSPWLTNPTCVQDKLDWLEEHMGVGWAQRAIITKDKTRVVGDVLIDDKPTVHGVRSPDWQHVHFTQPYNAHLPGPRIDRWTEWRDVIEEVLAASIAA